MPLMSLGTHHAMSSSRYRPAANALISVKSMMMVVMMMMMMGMMMKMMMMMLMMMMMMMMLMMMMMMLSQQQYRNHHHHTTTVTCDYGSKGGSSLVDGHFQLEDEAIDFVE